MMLYICLLKIVEVIGIEFIGFFFFFFRDFIMKIEVMYFDERFEFL